MKKPKFLQRLSAKRAAKQRDKLEKKAHKFQQSDKGRILELERIVKEQKNEIDWNTSFIEALKNERRQQEMEQYRQEQERTDPFKADKWKVVYNPKGQLSKVYLNGQQLHGAQNFSIDIDADNQTPYFNYYGSGSVEVITESE